MIILEVKLVFKISSITLPTTQNDKTDRGFKVKPIIDHLNKSFQRVFSNKPEQSIGEPMTKFKGHSTIRHYLKMKPIKWRLKWSFRCGSSIGYLYKFYLCLGWKRDVEINLGESVNM